MAAETGRVRRMRAADATRRRVRTTGTRTPRPRPARAVNGAGRRRRRRVWGRRRGVLAAVWAVITLALLVAALLAQLTLALVAAGLSALVTAAVALLPDDDLGTDHPRRAPNPAPRPRTGRTGPPRGSPVRRAAAVAPQCRQTGRPIDVCDCARRHVATADGARRYGRPVGSPIPTGGTKP